MANNTNNTEPEKRQMVRRAIGLDLLGYENLIHRFFVTWCEVISMKFHYKDRDLITNEALFNYYQNQWAILVENRLISEYGSYIQKDLPDTFKLYYDIMNEYGQELERYYPASLLPKTKITKTNKYQFNRN